MKIFITIICLSIISVLFNCTPEQSPVQAVRTEKVHDTVYVEVIQYVDRVEYIPIMHDTVITGAAGDSITFITAQGETYYVEYCSKYDTDTTWYYNCREDTLESGYIDKAVNCVNCDCYRKK